MKKAIRQFKETIELKSGFIARVRSYRNFNLYLIASAILVVSCFHIWQRVKVLDQVQEVARLKKSNKQLLDDLKKVNSDLAKLSMASRIRTYASDSLKMIPIDPSNLYTLVPSGVESESPDEFASMLSAIKRVADYFPVIEGNNANANELKIINLDTTTSAGQKE